MPKKINIWTFLSLFCSVIAIIAGIGFLFSMRFQSYIYSGYESDTNCRVEFGDGFFYVKESNAHYMNGKILDLQGLAEDYCQSTSEMAEKDDEVLAYECIPENGTLIRVHGSRGVSIPYVEGFVFARYPCVVRVFFYDNEKERTIKLPDGSYISPLAAYVTQFMLDSMWNHPDEFKERFRRLEKWEDAAGVEVSVHSGH